MVTVPEGSMKGKPVDVLGKGSLVPFRAAPSCSQPFWAIIRFPPIFELLPSGFELRFPESQLSWPELLIADLQER